MAEPMNHEDLAFLYMSGELEGAPRAQFETHRASCPACRKSLADISWVSSLVREAILNPSEDLVRSALRSTSQAEDSNWNRWDWVRALGLGLGLAFAVGLLVFTLSRSSEKNYSWRNGLEAEMRDVDRRLDRMDSSLSADSWSLEFRESWDDLSRRQRALERQLAKPEGA